MSSVYKGNDPNLRRTVAIKVIHPHLSEDPQFVSRFEEEAAAVAQLKHPNIIQVFDFDNDDNTYYMVLEFVPGETLQEYLERIIAEGKTMDSTRAREIIAKVCDALEFAHHRGMIHRDIKPANIMITDTGQVVLMDFGVAKMIGGKQHTATGAVVGTALYVSPEQVRGKDPDRRVDLYALGVTLFEMLSGRPPFEADSAMTTMMMHVNDPIPEIRELNAEVPDDLVHVVEKALQKERDDRFATAADMAKALRGAKLEAPVKPDMGKTTVEPVVEEVDQRGTVIEEPVMPTKPPETVRDKAKAPPPVPPGLPPSGPEEAPQEGGRSGLLAGGAAALVIVGCIAVAGIGYLLYRQFGGGPAAAVEPTPTPTETAAPPTATATEAPPTDTPEPTFTPSPSPPPEPYVLIGGISLSGTTYVVDYETFGYTEALPGMHIHFFFDTVPVANAGVPGAGPWYVWGGPRPFNGYTTSNKPAGASQLCALVANPNHSITPDTGNCFALPE
jgi:serine/threonine-protein kinase